MNILGKIGDFLSGGIGKEIVGAVKSYFPPSMSDAEKANLELAIDQAARTHELKLKRLLNDAQEEFNRRIAELEGTAKDLLQAGWLGKIVLFLRGTQRPAWGYATMYFDYMWFVGDGYTEQQELALTIVNVLVLVFLFGERGIKNVMPIINRFLESKGFARASPAPDK